MSDEKKAEIVELTGVKEGETLFFICDEKKNDTEKKAGHIRSWLAAKEQLDLIRDDAFEFCFIVDFPMYEIAEETGSLVKTGTNPVGIAFIVDFECCIGKHECGILETKVTLEKLIEMLSG